MARSHPPTLIKAVKRCLLEDCHVGQGQRLLLAVSGGRDSMALLSVLARLRRELGFLLSAHGVDHGLRVEAKSELARARELSSALEVPFDSTSLEVAPGGNLQARARKSRYRALETARAAAGAQYIATAHHADDRAETVLLRLLRGAGPRGLAVLPPRSGSMLRPMVRCRRFQVTAHLQRHGVPFSDDPSNADRRFLRVRVRAELLPLLEQLSPRIVDHLCSVADQVAPQATQLGAGADLGDAEVRLGRAQQQALMRALRQQRAGVRIPLARGLQLSVDRVDPRHRRAERRQTSPRPKKHQDGP